MKFKIGDETDKLLCTTLTHEFYQCTEAFNQFLFYAKKAILLKDKSLKIIKINCYNYYINFLKHLFEFYVGCFKRDLRDTDDIKHDVLDYKINFEVKKLLNNRIYRIKKGYAPSWENHISYYDVPIPDDFSIQFRKIRNRNSHTDYKRAKKDDVINLGDFHKKYHKFVYLLYESGNDYWSVKDVELLDWKAIEDFANIAFINKGDKTK